MMSSILDIIMLMFFVLFMVFIFGGYHKNKAAKRERDREREAKDKI